VLTYKSSPSSFLLSSFFLTRSFYPYYFLHQHIDRTKMRYSSTATLSALSALIGTALAQQALVSS
jgi:hypothetical protein